MTSAADFSLSKLIETNEQEILGAWLGRLAEAGGLRGRMKESELRSQAQSFLGALRRATATGNVKDIAGEDYAAVRDVLDDVSRSRSIQGFSSTETAMFVMSLKAPLFACVSAAKGDAAADIWTLTELLDRLALYSTEAAQRARELVIIRQQEEIAELSTPVVQLWEGILALPLIGTLDSSRTQVVMENLLQAIVDTGAEIAIIDITGVPTVDTLVAQHLLKTVAAARLMGADCIISGIRPQIAQTIVHLGVELNVISKASLADAFAIALKRTGRAIVRTAK